MSKRVREEDQLESKKQMLSAEISIDQEFEICKGIIFKCSKLESGMYRTSCDEYDVFFSVEREYYKDFVEVILTINESTKGWRFKVNNDSFKGTLTEPFTIKDEPWTFKPVDLL